MGPKREKDLSGVPKERKFQVLVCSTVTRDVSYAEAFAARWANDCAIQVRVIVDDVQQRIVNWAVTYPNYHITMLDEHINLNHPEQRIRLDKRLQEAYMLCKWADILVLSPIDAGTIGAMLNGITGRFILEVLRSWDVSKPIIMVPGMTDLMWENPMTRTQLNKIRKEYPWIKVMKPILWRYPEDHHKKITTPYKEFNEIVELLYNYASTKKIGHDVVVRGESVISDVISLGRGKSDKLMPGEIWTMIFEEVGDWELAMAVGVYTTLPTPQEWLPRQYSWLDPEVHRFTRDLDWTILTNTAHTEVILSKLADAPKKLAFLSSLSVKLIIKFGLTDVLTYVESKLKEVFSKTFESSLISTKASAVYGRPEILEWWRTSPSFLKKDYTVEAVDGASKSGFVHVLDWWRKSGLDLKYTEAALEQASAKGHIHVLEWWKEASMMKGNYLTDAHPAKHTKNTPSHEIDGFIPTDDDLSPAFDLRDISGQLGSTDSAIDLELPALRLKVGKSIIAAAQNGRTRVVQWWDKSGIPYSHSESVAKIASAHGHVNVLEAWKELKGDKFAMSIDNQVLVGPTKNGFVKVLEWWKQQSLSPAEGGSRLRIEYKTCDIEEALEDSVRNQGGEGEAAVRKWWAKNGLNLGVGTSEWMKVKVL